MVLPLTWWVQPLAGVEPAREATGGGIEEPSSDLGDSPALDPARGRLSAQYGL